MSIVNIRTRIRSWRLGVDHNSKPKGCLRVERNREGNLYFRQPKGEDEVTTWHIYPSGEGLLNQSGVIEGKCLGSGLLRKLRAGGHLYTQNGKAPAKARQSKSSTSTEPKSKRKRNHRPVQHPFSWGFGLRGKQQLKELTKKPTANPSILHPKTGAVKSQSRIHPGWLTLQDNENPDQDSTDEHSQ